MSSSCSKSKRKSHLFHTLVVVLFIVVVFFLTLIGFGRYVYRNEPTNYEERYFITIDDEYQNQVVPITTPENDYE